MNKNRKIIGILQILIILAVGITAITYVIDDETVLMSNGTMLNGNVSKGDGTVTVVASPSQTKEETPRWANESTNEVADLGENLALGKTVTDNGFNDVYEAKNVTDGIPQTYWEGKPADYPNIITVDLGVAQNITKIRVRLNPDVVWSKRVENFSVSISTDGKTFKEIVAAKDYNLDPKTGNMAIVALNKADNIQFVQLQFTKNTGASSAQMSEFEIY